MFQINCVVLLASLFGSPPQIGGTASQFGSNPMIGGVAIQHQQQQNFSGMGGRYVIINYDYNTIMYRQLSQLGLKV